MSNREEVVPAASPKRRENQRVSVVALPPVSVSEQKPEAATPGWSDASSAGHQR
jgi:hypothetical protein